jgi:RND family efflux transporter MFP subunit
MKMLARFWAVVFLALLAGPTAAAVAGEPETDASPVMANGWLEPGRQLTLKTPSGGRVESVAVAVGQRVKAGDLLVELDDTRQTTAVKGAELEVERHRLRAARATAHTEAAERQLELDRKLAARAVIGQPEVLGAQKDLEVARLERQEAEVEMRLAELALDVARRELESRRILAPFDGTVSRVGVCPGELVEAGQRLGELIDTSRLVARVPVRRPDARRLRGQLAGATARVTGGDKDAATEGQVLSVSPVADPSSGYVEVAVEIDGAGGQLIPGEQVTVHIAPKGDAKASAEGE